MVHAVGVIELKSIAKGVEATDAALKSAGISLISGYGPPIKIEIFPYGEVGCKFLSQFISAGINQTQHKIYVQVDTFVNVVLPFKTLSVRMKNEVLVCESVIIGEIPETYLKSNSLTEMLELVP